METYRKKTISYRLNKFWRDYCTDYKGTPKPFIWLYNFQYWFKYTFIKPFNVVKIKTLPKGPWQEADTVLLHANFQILTNYVECVCRPGKCYSRDLMLIDVDANMKDVESWPEEDKKKIRENLEEQNRSEKEICDLYEWWTIKRPIRLAQEPLMTMYFPSSIRPSKESRVASRNEYGDPTAYSCDWINEPNPARDEVYKKQNDFEEMSEKEDTEMLIRLIKIRNCLWT